MGEDHQPLSGLRISDGILSVTVLEHSSENYQNILKRAPSIVRTSYSAMRGWLREYAETLRQYDGTSGFSSLQSQSQGPAPMEVDQTRAVPRFPSGKGGRGKARARMAKAKVKARRARKAKSRNSRTITDSF